jgi:hypothetical protein
MHFNEELLTEERYLRLNGKQQSEHIANHCTEILLLLLKVNIIIEIIIIAISLPIGNSNHYLS